MTKSFFITTLLASYAIAFGISAANAPAAFYDKPAKVVHLPLPRDPLNPDTKPVLSCFYYPHLMVKQVDLGEKGADQISIIPISGAQPACMRANIVSEKMISADDWSGYFGGLKRNYVFLSAADGTNGGMGFAVFTADGKKVYDDVAKQLPVIDLTAAGVILKYARVYEAKCPLRTGADACWQKLKADTGIMDARWPDCESAYKKALKQSPQDTSILTDPSVINYNVTVAINGNTHTMTPTTGHANACWLAD